MHVPKPVIVVFIAACALLGIGVATAAVGDDDNNEKAADPTVPSSEVTTTAPTSTVPETAAPETGVPDTEAPDGDGDDGEGAAVARYYGPECGAEIPGGTHGDYVSRTAEEGGDVREMAHSNCGKPLPSVHDTTPPAAGPTDDGQGGPTDHPLGGPPGQTKDKGKPEKP